MLRHAAAFALAALPFAVAHAQADFIVSNIKVEGLQRVSEGTVFNYLPLNIGDSLSTARVREAIRALFATGFFRDVQMRRDGTTLIVVVAERPSIESFEITGNKDIKTEDLQKSLRIWTSRKKPVANSARIASRTRAVLRESPILTGK